MPARPPSKVGRRSVAAGAGAVVVLVVVAAIVVGLGGLGRSSAPGSLGAPHFVEQATAAGISQVYDGGPNFSVGGGVALLDCNGDG